MNRKALTLMEIVISITILSLTMAGMLNVLVSAKKHGLHSRYRVMSAELGRVFLDPLQMDVRQDTWSTNCLASDGSSASCPGAQTITDVSGSTMTFTPVYTISAPLGGGTLRRVRVDISWNER